MDEFDFDEKSGSKKAVIKVDELEDIEVKCADCEKTLLQLVRVQQTEEKKKLIVDCPFCDGESWLVELSGKNFQSPPTS